LKSIFPKRFPLLSKDLLHRKKEFHEFRFLELVQELDEQLAEECHQLLQQYQLDCKDL
jgi:hypothetical protein